MTKLALIFAASTLTLGALSGCGDDDDEGSGSGKYSAAELAAGACEREAAGMMESDCDYEPYTECYQTQCAAQYEMCLGANYKSGDFTGGACEEYFTCQVNAPDPCAATCEQTEECTSCFFGFLNCGASCTLPACATPAGSGPSPAGSVSLDGTCDELETCCAAVPSDQTESCNMSLQQLMAAGDLACSVALATYQAGGLCP